MPKTEEAKIGHTQKKRTWDEDIAILEYLVHHDVRDTAHEFKMTEGAVRAWLHRVRKRITHLQNRLNKIRAMQKSSPRIRKLTTDGSVVEEEEEEAKWK